MCILGKLLGLRLTALEIWEQKGESCWCAFVSVIGISEWFGGKVGGFLLEVGKDTKVES